MQRNKTHCCCFRCSILSSAQPLQTKQTFHFFFYPIFVHFYLTIFYFSIFAETHNNNSRSKKLSTKVKYQRKKSVTKISGHWQKVSYISFLLSFCFLNSLLDKKAVVNCSQCFSAHCHLNNKTISQMMTVVHPMCWPRSRKEKWHNVAVNTSSKYLHYLWDSQFCAVKASKKKHHKDCFHYHHHYHR